MRALLPIAAAVFLPVLSLAAQESATTSSANSPDNTTLKVGGPVSPDALAKADWIQGKPVTGWEPDKVYLFECWATWCGPCVKIIPHVNDLHQQYADKGLVVVGMDVWEDDKPQVEAFVKKMNKKMTYPVAYVGKNGAFEKEWLAAAGVTGIPHTFVVKNGKLALAGNPALITNEIIDALLLPGDEGVKKAREIVDAAADRTKRYWQALEDFRVANEEGNLEKMRAACSVAQEIDGDSDALPVLRLGILIREKKWEDAKRQIQLLPSEAFPRAFNLRPLMFSLKPDQNIPPDLLVELVNSCESAFQQYAGPTDYTHIARLLWASGKKEEAIAAADKAIAFSRKPGMEKYGFRPKPYAFFKAELERGNVPTEEEMLSQKPAGPASNE